MTALVAWCLFDGKPGHESQVMGLVNSLGELLTINPYYFSVRTSLLQWSLGWFPPGRALRSPDILIGAGHGTHIPLLTARRARGGRIILLMNPSLPTALFDLCIIPEHDRPRPANNILLSRGALSRIQPSLGHDPLRGLLLIGGPSADYIWSDSDVIAQVDAILARSPDCHWILSTSRRTPASFIERFCADGRIRDGKEVTTGINIEIVSWPELGAEWVLEQLGVASQVWVTEESVSMVYDALTAGASVGLLSVPKRKLGRVARGVQTLVNDGLVIPFDAWEKSRTLACRDTAFNEAARCSRWICDQWLSEH